MKFTEKRVGEIVCPPGRKDVLKFDDELKGFAVRVTASGGRHYLAQYTHNGIRRRMSIGSYDQVALAEARDVAREIFGRVARGEDPALDRQQQRQAKTNELTFGSLLDRWKALHLDINRRPAYAKSAMHVLQNHFKAYLDRDVVELDRKAVLQVIDRATAVGKTGLAGNLILCGGAAFGWAIKRGMVEVNPFKQQPRPKPVQRERVLTDEELRKVWLATGGNAAFHKIIRVLMLTGQRRSEVAGMTWAELSEDLSTWTIPANRSKNHKPHIVPLTPMVQDIIRSGPAGRPRDIAQRIVRDAALVFPGTQGTISSFYCNKVNLDRDSGTSDWRIHDLRRTVATNLQKVGVKLEVTEAVLGHVSGSRAGIVGVYQTHDYDDEKRAALNAWAKRLMAIVEGRPASAGNVVTMPGRKQKKTARSA
jgi:integrase